MTIWIGTDPRTLRRWLDALETSLSITRRYYDEIAVQAHDNHEPLDDYLAMITNVIIDMTGRMENIQEAINLSPEGREEARREQPPPSWE